MAGHAEAQFEDVRGKGDDEGLTLKFNKQADNVDVF